MEKHFCTPISAVAVHPIQHDVVAIGFFNGLFKCCMLDSSGKKLKLISVWASKLKRSIRGLEFSDDGAMIYVICENKALCLYDVKSGRRLRCIIRSYENSRPHRLISINHPNHYQLATGSDNGEIKIWDLNSDNPVISTFNDQTDSINSFALYKSCLLSASSDSTLCSYDFRQRKLRVQSEVMHSELQSIIVTNKYTCVGSGDGHLEIFKNGEYGNLLERIETVFSMGIDAMVEIKSRLLLLGGSMNDVMKFYHIHPHKQLQSINHFGGADILLKTKDDKYLIICSTYSDIFHVRKMSDILKQINNPDSAISIYAEKQTDFIKKKIKNSCDNFFNEITNENKNSESSNDSSSENENDEYNDDSDT